MTFYKSILSLCLLSSISILGACSYAVEKSYQDITFLTPGAQDAKCSVIIEKLRYVVYPPQEINIKKSPRDMEIICNAPGNRKIEMAVPAEFSNRALWGGPAGVAWDYASKSLYYYPSVIAVDFSQEELKPNKLPQHNNSDIRQPETYDLEEFKPAQPRLNSDKYKVEQPIIPRGGSYPDEYIGEDMDKTGDIDPKGEKANMESVLEGLTQEASDEVLSEDDSSIDVISPSSVNTDNTEVSGAPVQIYPGQ